jgi:hypothetical protein
MIELKTLSRKELDHLEWLELLDTGIILDGNRSKRPYAAPKSATHCQTYFTRDEKEYRIAYLRQIYDPETGVHLR